jgi:mRNA interferase HigB
LCSLVCGRIDGRRAGRFRDIPGFLAVGTNRRRQVQGAHSAFPRLTIQFPIWEPKEVRIVSERRIRDFIEREPHAADAMWRWVEAIESTTWRIPGDLKAMFAPASFVGDLTVFNVGGNRYRIAAFVHYRKQIVFIKNIGTHEEYDKWDL